VPAGGGQLVATTLTSVDLTGADPAQVAELENWSTEAREQLLSAYRAELALAGQPELLDEGLLAAYEAEQVGREAVAAWAPAKGPGSTGNAAARERI
jgi:predicted trehalose synthase